MRVSQDPERSVVYLRAQRARAKAPLAVLHQWNVDTASSKAFALHPPATMHRHVCRHRAWIYHPKSDPAAMSPVARMRTAIETNVYEP